MIPLLLAHPDIDVNVKNIDGSTPFYLACLYGSTSCVREMQKDSRVKVNEPNNGGFTPLGNAAWSGYLDLIKWWIASGREMDLGKPGDEKTDAIGRAKRQGETEVETLLERFKSDASKTRSEVRLELRITGQFLHLPSYSWPKFGLTLFSSHSRFPCDHTTQAHAGRVPCLS